MRRIFNYFPPEQLAAAELLLRQKNAKVRRALEIQNEHIFEMCRSSTLPLEDEIAWIRYYRPSTGQEWFCTYIEEYKLRCYYYCGEFITRQCDYRVVKMMPGVILDIYWEPKPFSQIIQTHVNCEEVIKRNPKYAQIMRGGK